ncbi:hypothetical protein I5L59_10490 [Pseudomonas moraviensis]|uniref:hypothetical protein n=1 Tax=Pseudomonas moraviensis TaxID=321662 RepID=UPI0018D9B1BF|nr:hypothetical protein [Pseudomonas moraviensis]MBH3444003.1 hypothetical protein [Pseudomonas moraviensis]
MGSEVARVKQRSASRKLVEDLFDDSPRVYVVHYSCESFYENATGGSTRVTSIAIRNLRSAQTRSWSIHKSAELQECLGRINENFPALEKAMLDGYFDFLRQHSNCRFVHWNMRDENYGFFALEHRFRTLGGIPFELQDDRKVDLARILVEIYGRQYASHISASGRKGRIFSIVELNNIADQDGLTGAQEAEAFENGEYLKLHQSTLRKLDMFSNIFERMHAKNLKTNGSWWDVNGIHPVYVLEQIKSHWFFTFVIVSAGLIGAAVKYWDAISKILRGGGPA